LETISSNPYRIGLRISFLFLCFLVVISGCMVKNLNWTYQYETYENGNPKSKILIRTDSVKDGKAVYYYPNQNIQRLVQYQDGFPVGSDIRFYESGITKSITWYSNQEENGPKIEFYPSGQIYRKTIYSNGKQNGKYQRYYKTGELEYIGFYDKGKPSGTHIILNKNGTNKSGNHKSYFITGEIQFEGNVIEGKPHGPFRFLNKSGSKSLQVDFKHGQLHGDYLFFEEDGNQGSYYWIYRHGNFIAETRSVTDTP